MDSWLEASSMTALWQLHLFKYKMYTVIQKTPPYYFLDNSVKNERILIIFNTSNTEKISTTEGYRLVHLTCKM